MAAQYSHRPAQTPGSSSRVTWSGSSVSVLAFAKCRSAIDSTCRLQALTNHSLCQRVVHHKAHVHLVNAHAKGNSRHHNLYVPCNDTTRHACECCGADARCCQCAVYTDDICLYTSGPARDINSAPAAHRLCTSCLAKGSIWAWYGAAGSPAVHSSAASVSVSCMMASCFNTHPRGAPCTTTFSLPLLVCSHSDSRQSHLASKTVNNARSTGFRHTLDPRHDQSRHLCHRCWLVHHLHFRGTSIIPCLMQNG